MRGRLNTEATFQGAEVPPEVFRKFWTLSFSPLQLSQAERLQRQLEGAVAARRLAERQLDLTLLQLADLRDERARERATHEQQLRTLKDTHRTEVERLKSFQRFPPQVRPLIARASGLVGALIACAALSALLGSLGLAGAQRVALGGCAVISLALLLVVLPIFRHLLEPLPEQPGEVRS